MKTILTSPIEEKCAWFGNDIINNNDWIIRLNDYLLSVLDAAHQHITNLGKKAPHFNKDDIHIKDEKFLNFIDKISDQLENGYGFIVIKGLDVKRFNEEELIDIYYILGLYLGMPVTQNIQQQLLGYVENVGDVKNKQTRVYRTNANLPYHSDMSDVVGLLSIRKAKEGGESSLVSFATVYNTILKEYPEYLAYYYHPAYYNHLGEYEPSLSPIFSYWEGKLACRYLRQYIEVGHERKNIPLSRVQKDALNIFDEISHRNELRINMILEPGDIQLCNNYIVMHSRTSFVDYDEIDKNRKLVRLWLKMPNARQLAPDFPGRNGFSSIS